MGSTRRTVLAAGAAAAATAAVPRILAQRAGQGGVGKFYQKSSVRIYYEEAGSGFPLMLLPGGGLNSTIAGLKSGNPFPRSRSSRENTAASRRTCATPPADSPPAPSRSTGRGNPMPMTSSA